MNSDFPGIITEQRKARKISQKQAAADLGISQALLSHYEKGIRECGLNFLTKIADYYDVSCDYLLGRAKESDSENEIKNNEDNIKLISNSVAILLSLAEETGNMVLKSDISSYFMLSIYKIFRIMYNSNSENNQNLFKISETVSENFTDSVLACKTAGIKSAAAEAGANKFTEIFNQDSAIPIKHIDTSLIMNVIKNSEDRISELCR